MIKSVRLTNFRSHETYKLECKKQTSLIVGENGCGKTSVLEAIYESLQGKSFRATDEEIIRRGAEYYRVEVVFDDGRKTVVTYDGVRKQFLVGDKKYTRLPRGMKEPVVLFLPSDLHLVEASPGRRRDYFDRVVGELNDGYGSILSKYTKALRQRNELLKVAGVRGDELFSWNILLAKYGCSLRKARRRYIEELNTKLTEVYRTIADNQDEVAVEYQAEDGSESEYLARLEADFGRDVALGHTSYGAHRDGYEFIFNGVAADGSASRGEVRSVVLAMKFIEAELIYEVKSKRPLVLLDDVFSELDEKRQKCLVKNFKDNQVVITSVEGV